MKVSVEEIARNEDEEILIRCHEVDPDLVEFASRLRMETFLLLGYRGDRTHRVKLSDVYYFEAVDGKVFLYGKDNVYEVKQKLYELEALCEERKCFRASKSTILNMTKIAHVYPTLSGRFEAVLDNGERVVISRQYVPVLRQKLGL
ncbi:LytTR family DNA-binding domain-containing protein [Paenibacillus aurantiacus]|uniref:LytTR family DNA-binding domain-containing protein n=1 Tax=Paenibacillus aurantiacus TaxID=1936118 RepID=A0ABV5KNA3_9BACL